MKAQEIVDYVFEIAPNPPFGTENFFEFGGGNVEVNAVGVAWWITTDMLARFSQCGITLGISHERVIYDTPATYHWGKIIPTNELGVNRRLAEFVKKHDIAIHRFHSNIDVADWGMPRALFRELGWQDYPTDWSRGVPVVEHPPVELRALIGEVKTKLRLPFVRYDGDLHRVIRRIAVPWGGICQWWSGAACAAPLGFDCVIGGDIIDGVVRLAREEGWAVIDAMHHATELEAMRALAKRLEQRFPTLQVHYFENSMPWAVMQ